MRRAALSLLLSLPALAASSVAVPREPFGNAHVQLMARAQAGSGAARLADLDLWAEGTRLRARVRGEPAAGEFWVDGLSANAVRVLDGKVAEAKPKTLEGALVLGLAASPSVANANTDRIAGHPCSIVSEKAGGLTVTRCIWRGLPLSIEVSGRGFAFNAAATLVEEGAVTVADLQPPPGAPAAPASMSAGR